MLSLTPVAAMTANAIPATTNAPIMNQRVLFRCRSDSVMAAPVVGQCLSYKPDRVAEQTDARDRVGRDDVLPTADDDALHQASASSCCSLRVARRVRSIRKAIITKKTPNALTRNGR